MVRNNFKGLLLPVVALTALTLFNVRVGIFLFSSSLPTVVVLMGMAFPTALILVVLLSVIGKIREIKEIESAYSFHGISILVAETNGVNRQILKVLFEKTGASVDFTDNEDRTASMIAESPGKYDLVFIDTENPGLNAHEACRKIRAIESEGAKQIPIVGMINKWDPEKMKNCISMGMNDCIRKPFDLDVICLTVKKQALSFQKKMQGEDDFTGGIAWDGSLALGDETLDTQHQEIFIFLGALVSKCSDKADKAEIRESLDFLIDYTVNHFNEEERLMLDHRYSGYKYHKQMHDDFKASIGRLDFKFKKNGTSQELKDDISEAVIRWLTDHILYEDRKIADYVRTISSDGGVYAGGK